MATTFTGDRYGVPVHGHGFGGNLKVGYNTYTIAANPTDGDIYVPVKVPAGATVVGGWVQAADIDTGTEALDMDVGWAATADEVADPDGFGNLDVWTGDVSVHLPVAGNYFPLAGVLQSAGPKTFTAEATIQVECNVTANAGGTGQITLVVLYVV